MRFIIVFLLVSFNVMAEDPNNCTRQNHESLWVEEYVCDKNVNIQVGHELINNSVVVSNENKTEQHYQEKDNQINMQYLKEMRKLNKDN
jgi:hypothetical protein